MNGYQNLKILKYLQPRLPENELADDPVSLNLPPPGRLILMDSDEALEPLPPRLPPPMLPAEAELPEILVPRPLLKLKLSA